FQRRSDSAWGRPAGGARRAVDAAVVTHNNWFRQSGRKAFDASRSAVPRVGQRYRAQLPVVAGSDHRRGDACAFSDRGYLRGVARAAFPGHAQDTLAIVVLIIAIAAANWVQYARTVRGSTLVEKNKEYVQAARVIGIHPLAIMFKHVLPNATGPVLVIATIN